MMALAVEGLDLLSNFNRVMFFLTLADIIISERTPRVDLQETGLFADANGPVCPVSGQSADNRGLLRWRF